MAMVGDKGDGHDGVVASIVSECAEEIGKLASNHGIPTAAFQLQDDQVGALGNDLANAPLQLFPHAFIKLTADDDSPGVGSPALKRVAVQASRRQAVNFDHLLRRFSNQVAQAIKLLRLMRGKHSRPARR